MGVQEVDPLIRNPTRVEGILGIKKNWSRIEWGVGSISTNQKPNLLLGGILGIVESVGTGSNMWGAESISTNQKLNLWLRAFW